MKKKDEQNKKTHDSTDFQGILCKCKYDNLNPNLNERQLLTELHKYKIDEIRKNLMKVR